MIRKSAMLDLFLKRRTQSQICVFSSKSQSKSSHREEPNKSQDERDQQAEELAQKIVQGSKYVIPLGMVGYGATNKVIALVKDIQIDPVTVVTWLANNVNEYWFAVALMVVLHKIDYKKANDKLKEAIAYVRYILHEAKNPEHYKFVYAVIKRTVVDQAFRARVQDALSDLLGIPELRDHTLHLFNMLFGDKPVEKDPMITVKFQRPFVGGPMVGTLRLSVDDREKNFKVFLNGPILTIKDDTGKVRNTPALVPTEYFEASKVRASQGGDSILVFIPKSAKKVFHDPDVQVEVPFI